MLARRSSPHGAGERSAGRRQAAVKRRAQMLDGLCRAALMLGWPLRSCHLLLLAGLCAFQKSVLHVPAASQSC